MNYLNYQRYLYNFNYLVRIGENGIIRNNSYFENFP